jgi:hypothetical protein
MKKWIFLCASLLFSGAPVFSQTDTIADNTHHAINLNPLGILSGAVGVSYEYLLMQRHGLYIDGSYMFPLYQKNKGYAAGISYRFHFHPRMKSNYAGLFYSMNYLESTVPDADRINYDFSFKTQIVGLNYGWRGRLFQSKLQYDYFMGLGVPFSTFTWGINGRPESLPGLRTKTYENIYKYSAILHAGLSIGYAF